MIKKIIIGIQIGVMMALSPAAVLAQKNTYPLTIRTSFMSGCMEKTPPHPPTDEEIKLCLCMLDLIQENYTYEQFLPLSEALDKKQPQGQELEKFIARNVTTCL